MNYLFSIIAILVGVTYSTSFSETSIQKTLIQKYTQKAYQDHPKIVSASIKVTIFNADDLVYPDNSNSFLFSFPEGSTVLGRTLLPLTFLDDQHQPIKQVKVAAEVTAKSYYLRTLSQLKRKHVIRSTDIEHILLPTYGKPLKSLSDLNEVIGKEVKSTIAKKTILTSWMIQSPTVIHRRQQVLVILNKKNMSIKLKGTSLDDGAVGDYIRVKINYKSNRVLQGEVINETTVRIPFMH